MSKIENYNGDVIDVFPEKEKFFKRTGKAIKEFWRRNKWWICGMLGAAAGAAAVYKAMNSDGEEVPAEESDPNTINVGDGTITFTPYEEVPADIPAEE